MTNEEILIKAIKKAVKNGYKSVVPKYLHITESGIGMFQENVAEHIEYLSVDRIIFDHNFAKAFWGEECHSHSDNVSSRDCPYDCEIPKWKKEIQKLALSKDRFQYIKGNYPLIAGNYGEAMFKHGSIQVAYF